MLDRVAHGFAASPVSSTTAAEVSSQEVSIPRISMGSVKRSTTEDTVDTEEQSDCTIQTLCPPRPPWWSASYRASWWRAGSTSNARFNDSTYGGLKMPRSVM